MNEAINFKRGLYVILLPTMSTERVKVRSKPSTNPSANWSCIEQISKLTASFRVLPEERALIATLFVRDTLTRKIHDSATIS